MLTSVWNSADQSETIALVIGVILVLFELVIAIHGLWEVRGGKNKAEILKKHIAWMALIGVVFGAANLIFSQRSNKLSSRDQASKIAATDPHNQPVSSISASAVVHIDAPDLATTFRRPLPGIDAGLLSVLFTNMTDKLGPTINEFGTLESDRMKLRRSGNIMVIEKNFLPWSLHSATITRPKKPCTVQEMLDVIEGVSIFVTQVTNDVAVLGGHVELVVNGNVRKTFEVLPDRNPSGRRSGFYDSLYVVATNTASWNPTNR